MATITWAQPLAVSLEPGWVPSPASIYRLTVDQYEAMVAAGLFSKRDRLHLIDGILVTKMTKNPPQAVACELTRDSLLRILRTGWRVTTAAPIRIPEYNEPEPDITVGRGNARDAEYRRRHPEPGDVGLIVEVADTSLKADFKAANICARAGVPVYGVINLVDRQVTVFSDPGPAGYRSAEHLMVGHAIPVAIDSVEVGRIDIAAILR
jgi:Uma2 family endonuclease